MHIASKGSASHTKVASCGNTRNRVAGSDTFSGSSLYRFVDLSKKVKAWSSVPDYRRPFHRMFSTCLGSLYKIMRSTRCCVWRWTVRQVHLTSHGFRLIIRNTGFRSPQTVEHGRQANGRQLKTAPTHPHVYIPLGKTILLLQLRASTTDGLLGIGHFPCPLQNNRMP